MKIFVSSVNIPIGYIRPHFPSLYWPLGASLLRYQQSFLYYGVDIWRFTVYWSLIMFGGFYIVAALIAVFNVEFNNRRHHLQPLSRKRAGTLIFGLLYVVIGSFKGFVSGAVVGLMLSAIYRAGTLSMSTWIPLSWAIAAVLFDVCSSYLTTLSVM
ncbi:uncharacterized protein CANTADRAFT_51857 [Suhomyces tanzawaensis NRRL Y-17324]|uniref:Integral membrane protein n=1 Tax=Suhomyces tanzawaensis NRRL Y-17324 TaxID=984487 RepID=A0A1E4SIF9_9ASCO|nr:uncharacterized protein CANTADRAFT_51857 [Suhomyces tanzawaensis NRRL Y-17324]ODV79212.1 hypothetical protein CANTADRAFT_51857 [Suhomyces tanzawaensis NRRL Y-17324]